MSDIESSVPLLWVDHDARDFRKILVFLKQYDIRYEVTNTLLEALEHLRRRSPSSLPKCIVLDAFVPIGGKAGVQEFPDAFADDQSDAMCVTGHLLLKHKDFRPELLGRVVVLSVLGEKWLQEREFPKEVGVYFSKTTLEENDVWNQFCNTIRRLCA